jgi:hypothetical protein
MDHVEILKTLLDDVARATEASDDANESFRLVMKDIPSGMPHPDGVQRIHNVSSANAVARKNLHVARARLQQYQVYGFVPKDLKAS